MRKKILMTLALLLTAVTGAWADDLKELIATATDGQVTYTGEHFTISGQRAYGGLWITGKNGYSTDKSPTTVTISSKNGEKITKIEAVIGDMNWNESVLASTPGDITGTYAVGQTITISSVNATEVTLSSTIGSYDFIAFSSWTIYYTTEPPIVVIPVAEPAANTQQWTFTQPGSDVVLTPIYSAATIYDADGQTEKQAYETLKEAFANVQDGDVIKLDWNVTLTEGLATPSTASAISFTLDFNGFVIDNTGGTNYIVIDNGCELTLTDNTATQMGGLKCQYPIAGSNGGKVIFQGGRYSFNGCSSQEIALEWDGLVSNYGWVMGDGKEFVDLNNGNLDDDGFPIRVDWKAFELTIGAGRFATFYSDQNTTLADGTDANIGLYTINDDGINLANNTVTVTKVNDPIAIADMPLLVYNGTTEQKTVTLKVTPVAPTADQTWSSYFQGTAVDKTFDADDMAKADYYVLSGGKAFAPVRGTGTIAKNKCWLQFDHANGAPARSITIVFDETTGVNEVIEVNEVSDDSWYDLNGRKLNAKPTRKGVYVKDGKKVVK